MKGSRLVLICQPFKNRTNVLFSNGPEFECSGFSKMEHSKTRLVQYLDPHCMYLKTSKILQFLNAFKIWINIYYVKSSDICGNQMSRNHIHIVL
jgi:hypothetical protein